MSAGAPRVRIALVACLAVSAAALAGGGTAGSQEAGGDFVTSVTNVSQKSASDSKARKETFAECPSGTVVIGGGAEIDGGGEIIMRTSSPAGTKGWRAAAFEADEFGGAWAVAARATCARDDGAEVTAGPTGPPGPVGEQGTEGKDLGCPCNPPGE